MALRHRGARGGLYHSDRGVQYASRAFRALREKSDFTQGMIRAGDCWGNAVVESFFATVTKELWVDGVFETRAEASRELSSSSRSGTIVSDATHRSTTGHQCSFEEEVLKAG
jgi:transposase InsO family protein